MLLQKRISILILIALLVLTVGIWFYFLLHQPVVPPRSLLLYTNYESPKTITNWIIDTETHEKWEVGKGLWSSGWSPLGKHIAFHTLSPSPFEIWISDKAGKNIQKAFSEMNYPGLQVKNYDWLSEQIIIMNVEDKNNPRGGGTYLLNLDNGSFTLRANGNIFMNVSPNGDFWLQYESLYKYRLVDTNGTTIPIPIVLGDGYFSPDGNTLAYSCPGKYKFSSLCIIDINMTGITNERKVTVDAFLNSSGEHWWSPDGKYLGFMDSPNHEERFRAIDVSNGATVYDWPFPTKTSRNFWSPRGDKIVDYDGLLLDLKTGQVSNFFTDINETTPSHIVDWRLIATP